MDPKNERNTARFIKAVGQLEESDKLKKRADRLWHLATDVLSARGNSSVSYGRGRNGDADYIDVEIPLGDYLALFPNETPMARTYAYDGHDRAYVAYPMKYLGLASKGLQVWISARTASVDMPIPVVESVAVVA